LEDGVDPSEAGPRARIVDAARQVFRDGALLEASLSDIAGKAGVARPNLYRYFPDRDTLVRAVVLDHMGRINVRRRAEIPVRGPVRGLVVESLLVGASMGQEDEVVLAAVRGPQEEVMARLIASDPELLALEIDYWAPVLAHGRERLEIAPGLSDERIVRWFMACQLLLAAHPELVDGPVRMWVSDFVVAGVVASSMV
jgi:AcrR family transcriptional regulator